MRRQILVLGLAALLGGGLVAPASAAEAPTGGPSTTVQAPSTTTTAPRGPVTGPRPTTTSTTAAPADQGPTVDDDAAVVDDGAPEAPPDAVEVPAAEAPVVPVEDPAVTAMLAARLAEAQARVGAAEAARVEADAVVQDLRVRLAAADAALAAAQGAETDVVADLRDARRRMDSRAAAAYVHGTLSRVETVIIARDANDLARRVEVVRGVLEADADAVSDLRVASAQASDGLRAAVAIRDDLARQVADASAVLDQRAADVAAALAGLSGLQTGGPVVVVGGMVFPVAGTHRYTDTFGAARMPGTSYAHAHQGTDIFAATGTPLVAVERGVVTRMGSDVLGGTKLWVVGASGSRYYYAHLSAFAAGLHDGQVVAAGDLVGYVGNTGNARTTPPHLHFEVHPGGGAAANPFPLLRALDEATAAARATAAAGPQAPVVTPPVATVAPGLPTAG